ncbi:hypothetical protein ACMFMG_011407 [Clarireedia jacksonii]
MMKRVKDIAGIVSKLQSILARADSSLSPEHEATEDSVSTNAVLSTYPRAIHIPQNRQNSDRLDIGEIDIAPTEDEIRSDNCELLPSTDLDHAHFVSDPSMRLLDTHFRLEKRSYPSLKT